MTAREFCVIAYPTLTIGLLTPAVSPLVIGVSALLYIEPQPSAHYLSRKLSLHIKRKPSCTSDDADQKL